MFSLDLVQGLPRTPHLGPRVQTGFLQNWLPGSGPVFLALCLSSPSLLEEGSFVCGLCPIFQFVSVLQTLLFTFDTTFCKLLN